MIKNKKVYEWNNEISWKKSMWRKETKVKSEKKEKYVIKINLTKDEQKQ